MVRSSQYSPLKISRGFPVHSGGLRYSLPAIRPSITAQLPSKPLHQSHEDRHANGFNGLSSKHSVGPFSETNAS